MDGSVSFFTANKMIIYPDICLIFLFLFYSCSDKTEFSYGRTSAHTHLHIKCRIISLMIKPAFILFCLAFGGPRLYVSKWFQFDCSIVCWQTRSVDDFTHIHSNDAIVTEHLKLNRWIITMIMMVLMPSALTFIGWQWRPFGIQQTKIEREKNHSNAFLLYAKYDKIVHRSTPKWIFCFWVK